MSYGKKAFWTQGRSLICMAAASLLLFQAATPSTVLASEKRKAKATKATSVSKNESQKSPESTQAPNAAPETAAVTAAPVPVDASAATTQEAPEAPKETKAQPVPAPQPAAQAQKKASPTYEACHADVLLFVIKKNPKLGAKRALASTKALVAGAKTLVKVQGRSVDEWLPLIVGVAKQESTFHPKATSVADARGIMQVHWPTWGKKLERVGLDRDDLYDPLIGAQCGTAILAMYIKEANGSIPGALYKYYGTRDKSYAMGVLNGALEFERFRKSIPQEKRQALLNALLRSAG